MFPTRNSHPRSSSATSFAGRALTMDTDMSIDRCKRQRKAEAHGSASCSSCAAFDTCGASALVGALAIIHDVPTNDVIDRLEPSARLTDLLSIEKLAERSACAIDDAMSAFAASKIQPPPSSPEGKVISGKSKSMTTSTSAALPAFGLGLKRQRSICPPSILTDEETSRRSNEVALCAAALNRLIRCHDRVGARRD